MVGRDALFCPCVDNYETHSKWPTVMTRLIMSIFIAFSLRMFGGRGIWMDLGGKW